MYRCKYDGPFFFEWDHQKNQANIRKHGIDFKSVEEMFRYPMLVMPDTREDYGEERTASIGWLREHVGVVVYTERRGDVIRVISARKATREESRIYAKTFQN
ncbi:MAG TPA: hypothetical protein DIT18_00440 [Pseudomonas sp.]|nr:hypothetical protein [Pseudomonas sp.]